MRFELTIPDSTHPDIAARIGELLRRLSEAPELVQEMEEQVAPESDLDEETLAKIDAALESVRSGKGHTSSQVDAEMKRWKAEFMQRQRRGA